MDTEFNLVLAHPVSDTYSKDFNYNSFKCNVDLLKIIQLGLTFADENGNFAKGYVLHLVHLCSSCNILIISDILL